MDFILEAPLVPLTDFRQFMLWRLEDRGQPKLSKIPFDSQTGQAASAHDPQYWMTADEAVRLAQFHKCGVAFVLTENDPFFCIDLDNQLLPDGQWSPYALSMIEFFAGAAVEISYSGTGLHIFGRYDALPGEHRVKIKDLPGLEVYTRKRFIALGHSPTGDANTDHTGALNAVIAQVGGSVSNVPANWTDTPVAEFTGSQDDSELISKMLASGGRKITAGMAFDGQSGGGKATVQDLWAGSVDALSLTYPSSSDKSFDHSSADMGLCLHLAFWTGKDCARIDRLFRMSALMRPKWERVDYMRNTILEACRVTQNVYTNVAPGDAAPVEPTETNTMFQYRQGLQFLDVEQQRIHFEGCIYIQDPHKILIPDGSLLGTEQFKAMYGGYEFSFDFNGKLTINAWEAFTQSRIAMFPKAQGLCFRPEVPPGACVNEEGRTLVNTYVPANVDMRPGDVTPFLNHIAKLIPDPRDQEILISYIAACVQYPGVKFQWCPVIQGVEGNGKSLMVKALSKAIGERYTHKPNADDIANKFNHWIYGKLLIACDEIHFKGNQDIQDALKKFVTDDRIEIQKKGGDQVTGDNRANWIFTTNHRDAVIKQRNGRRYSIFFTAQQHAPDLARDGMTGEYFPRLFSWLASGGYAYVAHYLKNLPINDEFNPATTCHVAPDTSSNEAAIRESMGRAEQEIIEAVEAGEPGFCGGWISSIKLKELLDNHRIRMNRNKVSQMLDDLGYIRHPELKDGRASGYIFLEGPKARPVLYIQAFGGLTRVPGHEVKKAYMVAQGYAVS